MPSNEVDGTAAMIHRRGLNFPNFLLPVVRFSLYKIVSLTSLERALVPACRRHPNSSGQKCPFHIRLQETPDFLQA